MIFSRIIDCKKYYSLNPYTDRVCERQVLKYSLCTPNLPLLSEG